MSKATVTRLFVASILAMIAGFVVCLAAVVVAITGNVFVMSGPDVVGVQPTALAWGTVAVCVAGCVAMIGGAIAGLIAWIGALLNTAQMNDKTWFVVLLVLGLCSFGFVAMLAYIIAGPDGMQRAQRTAHAPA